MAKAKETIPAGWKKFRVDIEHGPKGEIFAPDSLHARELFKEKMGILGIDQANRVEVQELAMDPSEVP